MEKYIGFRDLEDVRDQFDPRYHNKESKELDLFPTEDEMILAIYDVPSYEGYALVIFEKDGKLYEANGSHCSCYGLEGQWSPEETSWEALKMRKKDYYLEPSSVKVFSDLVDSKL